MLKHSIHAAAKGMQIDFEEVTENINHMGERGSSLRSRSYSDI
ncbi:hypothetical protein ACTWKA_15120 [Bacillus sp. 3A_MP1]